MLRSKKKKKRNSSFGGKIKQGVWHYKMKWHVLDKDDTTFQFVEKTILLMHYFYVKQLGD